MLPLFIGQNPSMKKRQIPCSIKTIRVKNIRKKIIKNPLRDIIELSGV